MNGALGPGQGVPILRTRVVGLVYVVSPRGVTAIVVDPEGRKTTRALGDSQELLPKIEALQEELRNTMAVARGKAPRLDGFMAEWGRTLIPSEVLDDPPDVLVVVPHALMHDLPLHAALLADGRPLGAASGVCYCSSMSLFARCAARNPQRVHENRGPRSARVRVEAADALTGSHEPYLALANELAEVCGAETRATSPGVRAGVRNSLSSGGYDALIAVAHGHLQRDNHRMSGLLLTTLPFGAIKRSVAFRQRAFMFRDVPLAQIPTSAPFHEGSEILTNAEIDIDANLAPALVMLLGCSTGSGRLLSGDEPASLAETFLHVGASAVVSCMWDANINATREWARRFLLDHFQEGLPKALAARNATAALAAGTYANKPALYGPFHLRGDWI